MRSKYFFILVSFSIFVCFACQNANPSENLRGKKIILKCATRNGMKNFEISDNATEMDLYDSGITQLPATIGQLKNLTAINLRGNRLTTLPETFTQLENLEILTLSGNPLEDFPQELSRLKKLKNLCLERAKYTASEQAMIVSLLPHCNINFESDEDDGD